MAGRLSNYVSRTLRYEYRVRLRISNTQSCLEAVLFRYDHEWCRETVAKHLSYAAPRKIGFSRCHKLQLPLAGVTTMKYSAPNNR
jgi:hypothetical protein